MKSKRDVGVEIDRCGHRRGSVDDGVLAGEDNLPGSSSPDLHLLELWEKRIEVMVIRGCVLEFVFMNIWRVIGSHRWKLELRIGENVAEKRHVLDFVCV